MTSVRAFAVQPAARRTVRDAFAEPDARWNLLLICVAAYTLAAVGRVHQLWPVLGVTRPTMLSAALALACIALDNAAGARLRGLLRIPTVRWLILLVVWAGLSIPLALWPGGAFNLVVNGLVKTLAMFIAAAVAVRGPRDVRRLIVILFAAAAIFASFVFTKFDVEPLTARFGLLVFYDSNEFALLAVTVMPFGAYLVWRATSALARVSLITMVVMIFIVFVGCGSRGGLLALACMLIFALLTLDAIKLRWRVIGFATIATAFAAMASDSFWKRLDSVVESEDDYNITSPTGRLQVWRRGVGYMLDRPILGVGAGNFATAEGTLSEYAASLRQSARGAKWSVAHNSYVQVGAELGIPGLLFFCAALLTAMTGLRRVSRLAQRGGRPDLDLRAQAQACSAALVGFSAGAAFLSLAYSDVLFALLAIATGCYFTAVRTKAIPYRLNPRFA